MKNKLFKIDLGTYPFDLIVDVGNSDDELFKYIHDDFDYCLSEDEKESLEMIGIGRTVQLENRAIVLRSTNLKDKNRFHANLAHEIFHVVEFLFKAISINHSVEHSGEAYAYQIQYITKKIYEELSNCG